MSGRGGPYLFILHIFFRKFSFLLAFYARIFGNFFFLRTHIRDEIARVYRLPRYLERVPDSRTRALCVITISYNKEGRTLAA